MTNPTWVRVLYGAVGVVTALAFPLSQSFHDAFIVSVCAAIATNWLVWR